MAQVLIIGVLALFLQLTAGQDACINALTTLSVNTASCTATVQNPTIICSGVCRGYYEDVFDNCSPAQAMATRQAFDLTCGTSTPATQIPNTPPSQDDACTNALATLSANIASCTATVQNPTIICSGVCRGYYDDIFDSCSPDQAMVAQQAFDAVCETEDPTTASTTTTEGPTTASTTITEGPTTAGTTATEGPTTAGTTATEGTTTANTTATEDPTTASTTATEGITTANTTATEDPITASTPSTEGTTTADGTATEGPTTAGTTATPTGGANTIKGLGIFSILISVIAAVIF